MNALPNDHAARERIRTDLTTNMLVEAGAGSGKTTSLVDRLLEHVRTGTPIERLTAVTFTRKAANELRERFQLRLERQIQEGSAAPQELARYVEALHGIDRAYLGTIHGFCARLLRERPLEIGIDPDFQETSGEDWEELRRQFWRLWIERAKRDGDVGLAAIEQVGIEPQQLEESFELVVRYPDVEFPLEDRPRPDVAPCRTALEGLLDRASNMMPAAEPDGGWDDLMRVVRRLSFRRGLSGWTDTAAFCAALDSVLPSKVDIVQKRWSSTKEGKAGAKELCREFDDLNGGQVAELLTRWREHRYPIVMRFLLRAAQEFTRQRHSAGTLGFEDLLLLTAKLLREHPATRDELGARYAHLLIDEFQDTDPVQAEVCFLLASPSSEGSDWHAVTPRPGSLFVVGDPKQSIFRFRRADIQVYEFVRRRMEASGGCVLSLTANFRSNDAIREFVNHHFFGVFPGTSTPQQAAFAPMDTHSPASGGEGVFTHSVQYEGAGNQELLSLDASRTATWIAERIARGERSAGDFLVLTPNTHQIERYARALSERNVATSTVGAPLTQEHELQELIVVLRTIADPENPIAVAAALEGLFFGLSPADLWSARQASLRFAITRAPSDPDHRVGRALMRLHEWWRTSQRQPADVLMERILDDTGLLLHAASQTLGDARAGALLHLVETLRLSSVNGANGISDAMERLSLMLDSESPDAPLRPGRRDAVRVMNLHKAKGLEATVVILAAPVDETIHEPTCHIVRSDDGRAAGSLALVFKDRNARRLLAQPPGWAELCAAEEEFVNAERDRLRYVAASRAKRELVVSQGVRLLKSGPKDDSSIWRPLGAALRAKGTELTLPFAEPPGRNTVTCTLGRLNERSLTVSARVAAAKEASVFLQTVTERSKEDQGAPGDVPSPRRGGRGVEWGRAVHRCIEAHARGRNGATLRTFALAVARDEELSDEESQGLLQVLVRMESEQIMARMRDEGSLRTELTIMRCADQDGTRVVTEGVLDLALLTDAGSKVTDWKTDDVSDEEWLGRLARYERQVGLYAEMLAQATGREAVGEVSRVRCMP